MVVGTIGGGGLKIVDMVRSIVVVTVSKVVPTVGDAVELDGQKRKPRQCNLYLFVLT
jgi:hypothetical protein